MKDLIDLMDLKSTNYKNEIQSIFSKLYFMVKFKDNNIRIHKILDKLILNVNTERLKNNPVNIDIKKFLIMSKKVYCAMSADILHFGHLNIINTLQS